MIVLIHDHRRSFYFKINLFFSLFLLVQTRKKVKDDSRGEDNVQSQVNMYPYLSAFALS